MVSKVWSEVRVDGQSGGSLDGFNFEVKSDQREDQTFEVLNQIVETAEAFGVFALVDVHQRPDFASREADVLVADHDFELLPADAVGLWPKRVVLSHDLGVIDDAFEFVEDALVDEGLLPDHCVVLVVRIIRVTHLPWRTMAVTLRTPHW